MSHKDKEVFNAFTEGTQTSDRKLRPQLEYFIQSLLPMFKKDAFVLF